METYLPLFMKREGRQWQAHTYGISSDKCYRPDDALRSLANRLEENLPEHIYGPERLWKNGRLKEGQNAADKTAQIIPAQF